MLADTLRAVAGTVLVDEDGDEHVLELLPPATDSEIAGLESELSGLLPRELREALRVSAGFANGPIELGLLDLAGFGMEDIFPRAFPLGHDGFGNYWVLDLLSEGEECGPVFFACHDPPVVAFQSDTASQFIHDVLALWQSGPRSPVDVVHEDVTDAIWASNSGVQDRDSALASDDAVVAGFAAEFPVDAVIADLRAPGVGDGFSWGRFGPRTEWRRAGPLRLWGAVPPPKRQGLISRIFGSRKA
ncbi:MAG: SMI1/KNR4 family protein [Gemmatimonadota bacterium]|nr:SMI1/KNR4 family protein [Gemmatimonadota bacterium]